MTNLIEAYEDIEEYEVIEEYEATVACSCCGEQYSKERWQLGYNRCLPCGQIEAEQQQQGWCIAPIAHKQGATLVTRRSDLLGLNKYMGEA